MLGKHSSNRATCPVQILGTQLTCYFSPGTFSEHSYVESSISLIWYLNYLHELILSTKESNKCGLINLDVPKTKHNGG